MAQKFGSVAYRQSSNPLTNRGNNSATTSRNSAGTPCLSEIGNACPGGTGENSPAFQRWDACHARISPEGTAESWCRRLPVQPSFRDSNSIDHNPGVETPGYHRDVPTGQTFIEFPKGISPSVILLSAN